jgi:hypothetical protein
MNTAIQGVVGTMIAVSILPCASVAQVKAGEPEV